MFESSWSLRPSHAQYHAMFVVLLAIASIVGAFSAGPLDVSSSCLDCICHATSGCSNATSCFQDEHGEVYCGILLLQEKHWQEALHLHRLYVRRPLSSANLGPKDHLQASLQRVFSHQPLHVLGQSFDECYTDRTCSELVLRTIAVTHLTDCDGDHVLTCKDAALLHQLGVAGCGALRAHALGRRGRIGARRPLRLLQLNENKQITFALEYLRVLSTHRCIAQPLYSSADPIVTPSSASSSSSFSSSSSSSTFASSVISSLSNSTESSSTVTLTTTSITSTLSPIIDVSAERTEAPEVTAQHMPIVSASSDHLTSSDSPVVKISAACFRCIRTASANNSDPNCSHPLQKCGHYAITFHYYMNANGEQLVRQQFPHLNVNKTNATPSVEFLNQSALHRRLGTWNEAQIVTKWLELVQKQQLAAAIAGPGTLSDLESNALRFNKKETDEERTNFNDKLTKLLPQIDAKDTTDTHRGFVDDAEEPADADRTSPTVRPAVIIRRNSRAFLDTSFDRLNAFDMGFGRRTGRIRRAVGANDLKRLPRQSKVLDAKQLLRESNQSESNFEWGSAEANVLVDFIIQSSSFKRYQQCVQAAACAEQLVQQYVHAHLIDCNLDRIIDCDDFAGIHWFGHDCRQTTLLYSNFWKNFEYCSILADDVRREAAENSSTNSVAMSESIATSVDLVRNVTHASMSENSSTSLPPFVIRPTTTGNFGLNTSYSLDVPSEGSFFDKLPVDQYYANHIIELSVECLQCICEASSETFNCTEAANPQTPSSFYFSSYKMSADTPPPPPPPIFFKLQRQRNSPIHHVQITQKKWPDKSSEPLYFQYMNNGQFEMTDDARIEYKALGDNRLSITSTARRRPSIASRRVRRSPAPSSTLTDAHEVLEICPNEKSGCGPFGLTKRYWIDAGAPMYRGAANDFDRCAYSPECAAGAVAKYISRNSADCTKDGRLSCADFGLIHKFKDKCADLAVLNSDYYRRFDKCLNKLGLH